MESQIMLPGQSVEVPNEEGSVALMRVINRVATMPEFDVTKLQALLDMKMKYEADEARKAFVVAMNAFKSAPPELRKNKHVEFGNTKYDHATLDNVVDTITAGLSRHGLSHAWKVEQGPGQIKVTCVITHEQGHGESVTIEAPTDTSGSKNAIQAIGSAITYLQRYTLLSATGMAAKGMDDDGNAAYSMGDLGERLEWIENCRNLAELQKVFGAAYKVASEGKDKHAMAALIAAKDAKKKALQ